MKRAIARSLAVLSTGVLFFGGALPTAFSQSVEQLTAAAKKNDLKAAAQLGLMYMQGNGVSQDVKEAVKWLKIGAKSDARAQLALGFAYALGEGASTKPDPRQAFEWFKKAADQGVVEAQFKVAFCYDKGLGTKKDEALAASWYEKAAEQGLAEAQEVLGAMYYQGRGVGQDYAMATKWYGKAAEQGFIEAQYRLGVCYSLGQGVPKDFAEAYKWITLASNSGRKDIGQYREKMPVYNRMTPEQVADGEKRAKSFVVKR